MTSATKVGVLPGNRPMVTCIALRFLRACRGEAQGASLNPLDFSRRMLPKNGLHVRCKFAQNITNYIRAQGSIVAIVARNAVAGTRSRGCRGFASHRWGMGK